MTSRTFVYPTKKAARRKGRQKSSRLLTLPAERADGVDGGCDRQRFVIEAHAWIVLVVGWCAIVGLGADEKHRRWHMWREKREILRTCGMHAAVNSERWRCLLNRFRQACVERRVANERRNIAENLEFHFGAISGCDIFYNFTNAADELRAQIVVENAQRSLHDGGLRNNVECAACRKLADGERRFLIGWHFARDELLQREVDVHGGY